MQENCKLSGETLSLRYSYKKWALHSTRIENKTNFEEYGFHMSDQIRKRLIFVDLINGFIFDEFLDYSVRKRN